MEIQKNSQKGGLPEVRCYCWINAPGEVTEVFIIMFKIVAGCQKRVTGCQDGRKGLY